MSQSSAGSFAQAPWQLRAFAVFAIAAAALDALTLLPGMDWMAEALLPTFGWLSFGLYLFAVLFSIFIIRHRLRRTLVVLWLVLGLHAIAQAVMIWIPRPESSNPYLAVGPWRPVWGILVPLLWIVILSSRKVKAYASE